MLELLNKIRQHARVHATQCALKFEHAAVSYQTLEQNVQQCAQALYEIPRQSYVALIIEDPLQTITYYLALLEKDCIPCLLDYRWSQQQIDTLISYYGMPFIIDSNNKVIKMMRQDSKLTKQDATLLHIGFTSGTTGLPKAYYRNEPSWIYSFEQNDKLFDTAVNVIVAPGPLSHSLSLYACIYALYSGRTFIGQTRFDATNLLHSTQLLKCKHAAMFLVPTMLEAYTAHRTVIYQRHYIFTTGDKLQYKVRNRVEQLLPNAILIEFFGTSEASFISYNYHNKAPLYSVGMPFENVNIQLINRDEKGVGLLNIQSNMAFSGYVGEEDSEKEWIETGDFASLDKQGYLFLHGRKYDRMIIGGSNVYPTEVERVAQSYEYFDEVLVIGVPHAKFGEISVLLYTGDIKISYRACKTFLSKHLARYQIPSKLIKVDKMEYTQSGKIARKHMKQRYLEGGFNS
ncbi:acyl-CoA synthetase [Staphylococcus succinus]|nr:AMP-binding protein [Staphylococcus succinus]RIN30492.1 acyl-CoA synthetase [Staphylococcus succinus]